MRRFNVHAAEFDRTSDRDGYRSRIARVAHKLGADQIGARLFELEDGQRSNPYHFHHGVEEWLLVIAGSPVVRTPEGERALRRGDVVCCPAGAGGAHVVTGPGTVLIVSDRRTPDVVEFPDSGKIELSPAGTVFRRADAVDFWEGE